jgi:hypothetical protein
MEEKYTYKKGDKVRVIKVEFTDKEWIGVGKVPVPFKIGDILTVDHIAENYVNPISFIEHDSYYPKEGFEPIDIIHKQKKDNSNYLIPIIKQINKSYEKQSNVGILTQ